MLLLCTCVNLLISKELCFSWSLCVLFFSGWSWSLWFTFCVSGFSSSICCWWRYADVYCNRHGCALWGKWGGLLFKVILLLLLAINFLWRLFNWWTEHLTIAIHTRYGSYPLRGKYCHEMALRIVLACIEVYIYI